MIVEVERGQDLGWVSATGDIAAQKCAVGCNCEKAEIPKPKGKVVRAAKDGEVRALNGLRDAESDVRKKVKERAAKFSLPMKISDAEWQWDRKKLTVFFTSEGRVDFRELVRDLASLFRTRIELRQIGARDEAKRLTGVGRCGREYCCSTWLPEMMPVSLSLAKDQRLSLNPAQISGGCGRLLCCLRYEHDFYVASRKRFPKEGRTINTSNGAERVQAVDIFRERVLLRHEEDGTFRTAPLAELREEVAARKPAPSIEEPKVPAALTTFEEGPQTVSDEAMADAVTPGRRGGGKRGGRRRGGRRGKGPRKRNDRPNNPPGNDGSKDKSD